jgi:hypothetical protein
LPLTKHPAPYGKIILGKRLKPFLSLDLQEWLEPKPRASGSIIALGMSPFGVVPQVYDHGLKGTAVSGAITVAQRPEELW